MYVVIELWINPVTILISSHHCGEIIPWFGMGSLVSYDMVHA